MEKSDIKVGTPVIYWGIIDENGDRFDPLKTEIASEAWEVCGEMVCKVKGKCCGVSIKHLDLITPGSLMAAKLSGLKEVSDDDIKVSTEQFFADKGVKATVTITERTNPY